MGGKVGVFMSKSDSSGILTLGLIGAAAYFLFGGPSVAAENPYTYGVGSGDSPSGSTPQAPQNQTYETPPIATSISPDGSISVKQIGSVKEGVDFINSSIASGSRIVSGTSNTMIGKNTGIATLAGGKTVKLTVTNKPAGTSFFSKPIKVINGKRTRVY